MAKIITITDVAPQPQVITIQVPGVQGIQGVKGDHVPSGAPYNATGTLAVQASWIPSLQNINLTGNLTIGALPDGPANASGAITFSIMQAATGGPYTVTWPATIKWSGGAPAPEMPTVANAEMIVHLFWTVRGWRGTLMGTYF